MKIFLFNFEYWFWNKVFYSTCEWAIRLRRKMYGKAPTWERELDEILNAVAVVTLAQLKRRDLTKAAPSAREDEA